MPFPFGLRRPSSPVWSVRVKQTTKRQMTKTLTTTLPRPLPDALRAPLAGTRILVLAPFGDDLDELARQLTADDIEVITAPSAAAAAARLHGHAPAAVILCAELETGTGYAALEALRSSGLVTNACPAIACSEHAGPIERLRALQRGCVDFLAEPIFYPELAARLQIATWRVRPQQTLQAIAGGLEINHSSRTVTVHGQQVTVTVKEFDLLAAVARAPERVWTKAQLLREVWGHTDPARTRTLDSHTTRLRSKLRDAGGHYFENVRGVGYRLTPERRV